MGYIDYSKEPHLDIAFIDMKSFYASVECVQRGLHPLKTSLCVMSHADNAKGLILACSPVFKEVFGKNNVGRSYELPFDVKTRQFRYNSSLKSKASKEYISFIETWAKETLIVPPRMALYIQENLKIQEIFKKYAPPSDIHPYSIDEGFIDLTDTLNYFIPNSNISRKDKLDSISAKIQHDIWKETGIFSTIGMSNANPLLAKLALDNEAKKTPSMRANWSYEDVETKVWNLKSLTDFWGIGSRMAARLNQLHIYSVRELANYNPDNLHRALGIIGLQLWFHANGVDESRPSKPYRPKAKGIGNSQVLPKDYTEQSEIEIVLSEMADQIATRLRRMNKKTSSIAIHIGFSYQEHKRSLQISQNIRPSQSSKDLIQEVLSLFRTKYTGGSVRNLGIRFDQLVDDSFTEFTFFDNIDEIQKNQRLEKTMDQIRDRFGNLSVQKATSLMEGSRVIERNSLIGGHLGGIH